ncbi:Uncharacterised protein [Vibrio cholerae]|nr:Uncharacterised protein [Vibrio cholerae]CSB30471.1 Uncharacterised protein [Vibrio cholerae]CSB89258.1 Uncharacterised protein [Vibrio cholerae]
MNHSELFVFRQLSQLHRELLLQCRAIQKASPKVVTALILNLLFCGTAFIDLLMERLVQRGDALHFMTNFEVQILVHLQQRFALVKGFKLSFNRFSKGFYQLLIGTKKLASLTIGDTQRSKKLTVWPLQWYATVSAHAQFQIWVILPQWVEVGVTD